MRRSVNRLLVLASGLTILFVLFYTLEPRKTAYSCRTVSSCLRFGSRHSYNHPNPVNAEASSTETQLRDGTIRFDRRSSNSHPDTLFLVLSKDATSWSSDFRSSQRSIYDFLDLLVSTGLDLSNVSLAMMTSSREESAIIKTATDRLPFARSTVLLRETKDTTFDYRNRHDPVVQLARRSALAALRNQLMLRTLEDEQHIVWVDADVAELSKDIVQTMIHHAQQNTDVGLVTARCAQHNMDNYDKNAWKVDLSAAPRLEHAIASGNRHDAVNELVQTRLMVPGLIANTTESDLVALDSVGGTILYIRADLVWQGVNFPTQNVVGTTWGQAGWVGVETEGICYVAKGMKGGRCYVLGGGHHVRHTDWG